MRCGGRQNVALQGDERARRGMTGDCRGVKDKRGVLLQGKGKVCKR